jgi:hypothetical protein
VGVAVIIVIIVIHHTEGGLAMECPAPCPSTTITLHLALNPIQLDLIRPILPLPRAGGLRMDKMREVKWKKKILELRWRKKILGWKIQTDPLVRKDDSRTCFLYLKGEKRYHVIDVCSVCVCCVIYRALSLLLLSCLLWFTFSFSCFFFFFFLFFQLSFCFISFFFFFNIKIYKQLYIKSEYGFSEDEFWKRTIDLTAKTLIALQPTLALKYREMFPKHKKRGADGIDIELSDEEEEDGEEGEVGPAKGAGVQRRRKSRVRSSDTSAASMAVSNSNNNSNSGSSSSSSGVALDKRISHAANDPLRPALFDQKVTVEGEDGDDSLRCFQVCVCVKLFCIITLCAHLLLYVYICPTLSNISPS